jgi:glyoxylase-like metal-dependent hydrolase (beta-lactamase superfamily II)
VTLATATIVLFLAGVALAAQTNPYDDSLLLRVRAAAQAPPGDLPRSVHYLNFAEAQAPLGALVSGEDTGLVRAVFPVFQIRFQDHWTMVDAGFDRATWSQFLPHDSVIYWQARYDSVQLALRDAERIVLTHEHWDHAAGVQHSPYQNRLAAKTLLTRAQLESLLDPPAPFYVRLAHDSVPPYEIIEDDIVHIVAPGVVLIKAAGHSPGSQMVYIRLASGQELILVGDLVWNMAGLERNSQKPEDVSRSLGEDRQAVQQQIDWIRRITGVQGIVAVPCHDGRWLDALTARGLLISGLDLGKS